MPDKTAVATRNMKIGDRDCGMNRQIAVLLHALSQEDIDLPWSMDIRTLPYGNCRERGFVLSVSGASEKPQNLCFFEHRNSDAICALFWEGYPNISGVARCEDIPEGVFPDKWTHDATFKWMDIAAAISLVRKFIDRLVAQAGKAASP